MHKKSLGDMSFAELGKLFPIIISEYNPQWPVLFLHEKQQIENVVGQDNIFALHHFGSTSVEGLAAKPTIDIMLIINFEADTEKLKTALLSIGYEFSWKKDNPPPHMMFMKGYTPNGFKGQAYHLHVRYGADHDELIFRDYLRRNQTAKDEYSKLKHELKVKFEFDREGYTNAKSEFIIAAVVKAKRESDLCQKPEKE